LSAIKQVVKTLAEHLKRVQHLDSRATNNASVMHVVDSEESGQNR